jgi:hypothetical protein
VPTAFVPQSWRRPVAALALWLVVVQTFLAGVATAQAGAAMADPLAGAVICHSGGAASDPAQPDAGMVRHLCCSYCISAHTALPPPAWHAGPADQGGTTAVLPFAEFVIVTAREAVRAGSSQGPPEPA